MWLYWCTEKRSVNMLIHRDNMSQSDWEIKFKLCDFRLSPRCKWYFTLFWGVTQYRVVILYRRFGRTYRYPFQGSRNLGILDSWRARISRWSLITWRTKWRTSFFFIPNGTEISVEKLPGWQHRMRLGQVIWFPQLCRKVDWLVAVW